VKKINRLKSLILSGCENNKIVLGSQVGNELFSQYAYNQLNTKVWFEQASYNTPFWSQNVETLNHCAISAFWPLPINSQRAIFLTVGSLLIDNSLFTAMK